MRFYNRIFNIDNIYNSRPKFFHVSFVSGEVLFIINLFANPNFTHNVVIIFLIEHVISSTFGCLF